MKENKLLQHFITVSKDITVHTKQSNNENFIFFNDLGIGYLHNNAADDDVYDDEYFKKYQEMSKTAIGIALNYSRLDFVETYTCDLDLHVDVGIGGGAFVERCGLGYDVNKAAIRWLKEKNLFFDVYEERIKKFQPATLSFWDVLEHIEDPTEILSKPHYGVFISMPIYKDVDEVLNSKHFKPNEHVWYFTENGLKLFMLHQGFELVNSSDIETQIGRESILSFFFKRSKKNLTTIKKRVD